MKYTKRLLSILLVMIMCAVSVVGCAPEVSQTPGQSNSPEATQTVTPTTTPDPTPEPTPTDAPIPIDAYFLVKDGEVQVTLVHDSMCTERLKVAVAAAAEKINDICGAYIPIKNDDQLSKIKTAGKIIVGHTKISDFSVVDTNVSWYDCVVANTDKGIVTMGYTQGAIIDALNYIVDNVVVTNDKQNVYIKSDVFGTHDRNLEAVNHAFEEFTISGYGIPSFSALNPEKWNEQDWKTYYGLVEFGVNNIPINHAGTPENAGWNSEVLGSVEDMRAFINKFYEVGITTRFYFPWDKSQMADFIDLHLYREIEESIKTTVEYYGDLEAIVDWGFIDEPLGKREFEFCGLVNDLFEKYDEKNRRVYVNMGPHAHYDNYLSIYDELELYTDPDYFCYDRYPFFYNEDGEPQMTDEYWYANLELNRDYGVDYGKDTGIIIGSIVVGCDPSRSEMTQEYMNWQVNTMIAYHHRYLEHFVLYSGHGCGLYTDKNDPTFRWYYAKNANKYAMTVGTMLLDKRLDAVFHLENADGTYDPQLYAYKGYCDWGEIKGCDAFMSFFSDGTLIVTDKRSAPADGGDHDVTITSLTGDLEWFNANNNAWEDISTCEAAVVDENGLTLTLAMATQYIIRKS